MPRTLSSRQAQIVLTILVLFSGVPSGLAQEALQPSQYSLSLQKIQDAVNDLDAAEREYAEKTSAFNRKWDRYKDATCHWVGDPSQCAWLDKLQAEQNREAKILNEEVAGINARVHFASSTINIQTGILRARLFIGCLHGFESRINDCADMPEPKVAAVCMIKVWEAHC